MKRFFYGIVVFFVLTGIASAGTRLSAEDFLPPAQAETPEETASLLKVKHPDKVEISDKSSSKEKIVKAETAQDAFNTVVDLKKVGCVRTEFGSGFGWIATGMGTYEHMEDVVASRISKRNAYISAYMMAKKELAQTLGGLSSKGVNQIKEEMMLVNKADDSLKSIESSSSESLEQVVQKFLKGFVLYSVFDDEKNFSVYVSIVSTPKTRGRFNRPDSNSLDAVSLQKGLDELFSELNNGLVPPVGGKMINIPATGEMAFVGFGSSVVRFDSNPAMNSKLLLQAERVADMRAAEALCGIVIGDETSWRGKLDERTSSMLSDFEMAQKGDPISFTVDDKAFKALESRKTSFINTLKESQQYESVKRGILPPGVIRRTWTDEKSGFSYAVAVYVPSATREAKKDSAEMDEVDLLAPAPEKTRVKKITEGKLERGASGQIHEKNSL